MKSLLMLVAMAPAVAHSGEFEELRRFPAAEAHQAVAVDAEHFYAIGSSTIGKYDKRSGGLVTRWKASFERPLIHLNSGVVIDGHVYCAHSNYPKVPMTSSIEIWDADDLTHVDSHSFGITEGSLTWIDRHAGEWWGVFAHYSKRPDDLGTEWTRLVLFDDDWQQRQSWVFPSTVIERFRPSSNSGGSFGTDGLLYCTGHDRAEVYVFRLPKAGSTLNLRETIPIGNTGQGIAWDRSQPGVLFAIHRGNKEVVVSKLR